MQNDCGIYCWYFIVDKKIKAIYIGQSIEMRRRKLSHLNSLKNHRHHNLHFQNLFNKYGESSLHYKVLEKCSEPLLTQREQYWYNYYSKSYTMINHGPFVDTPWKGQTHQEKTKKKISESLKGNTSRRGKPTSDETKARMSMALKGKSSGRQVSESTRRKMSEARKGKPSRAKAIPPEDVRKIRQLRAQGFTYREIYSKFPYGSKTIQKVILNKPPYDT